MTNKLTTVSNPNLATKNNRTVSLLGRGLNSLKSKTDVIAAPILEDDYLRARDVYNKITNYGDDCRFYGEDWRFTVEKAIFYKENYDYNFEFIYEFTEEQLNCLIIINQQLVDIGILFQELADKHFGKAYFPLALMYAGGQGVCQNTEKSDFYFKLAFEWCSEHKELIDPEIWSDLGHMYGLYYFHSTTGDGPEIWFCLGQMFSSIESNLGQIYGSNLLSEKEAVFWYQKAADLGDKWSQYQLGIMYIDGYGVEQDYGQAVFWYRKAADQGHEVSQYSLGNIYKDGRGIEQDYEQAVFWYRKAADQDYQDAQSALTDMYGDGLGLEQDHEQWLFWYRKTNNHWHLLHDWEFIP